MADESTVRRLNSRIQAAVRDTTRPPVPSIAIDTNTRSNPSDGFWLEAPLTNHSPALFSLSLLDVDAMVPKGDPLDVLADERLFTRYSGDRSSRPYQPMFDFELSGIMAFNTQTPRPAITISLSFDRTNGVQVVDVTQTTTQPVQTLTFTQADEIITGTPQAGQLSPLLRGWVDLAVELKHHREQGQPGPQATNQLSISESVVNEISTSAGIAMNHWASANHIPLISTRRDYCRPGVRHVYQLFAGDENENLRFKGLHDKAYLENVRQLRAFKRGHSYPNTAHELIRLASVMTERRWEDALQRQSLHRRRQRIPHPDLSRPQRHAIRIREGILAPAFDVSTQAASSRFKELLRRAQAGEMNSRDVFRVLTTHPEAEDEHGLRAMAFRELMKPQAATNVLDRARQLGMIADIAVQTGRQTASDGESYQTAKITFTLNGQPMQGSGSSIEGRQRAREMAIVDAFSRYLDIFVDPAILNPAGNASRSRPGGKELGR
jgi:hypothetical protein